MIINNIGSCPATFRVEKESVFTLESSEKSPITPSLSPLRHILATNPRELKTNALFRERYPHLTECTCKPRLTNVRLFVEDEVVKRVLLHHPPSSFRPLSIVSVGSGGCFQELIYIIKLASKGYQKFEILLIDDDPEVEKAEKELTQFVSEHLCEIDINFTFLFNFDLTGEVSPDILLMIDLEGTKNVNGYRDLLDLSFSTLRNSLQNDCVIGFTSFYFGNTILSYENKSYGAATVFHGEKTLYTHHPDRSILFWG